jgi:hypothetical protein
MFEDFVEWLEASPLTAALSDTTNFWTWLIIPVSQCVHIVCVAIVMISVGMLNLKLLGIGVSRQSFGELVGELMPWIWSALTILFITGTIQTIAEPGRELLNIAFRTKMVLLLVTVLITAYYEATVKKDPNHWNSPEHRNMAHVLASISIVFWIGIVSAGRMIAYLDFRKDQ